MFWLCECEPSYENGIFIFFYVHLSFYLALYVFYNVLWSLCGTFSSLLCLLIDEITFCWCECVCGNVIHREKGRESDSMLNGAASRRRHHSLRFDSPSHLSF